MALRLSELKKVLQESLKGIYPETEITGIQRIIVEDLFNRPYSDLVVRPGDLLSDEHLALLWSGIERLCKNEPIQYIVGKAHFYGLDFEVNKHTLIPRQETEELVDLIIQENSSPVSVLDIGTGSGCIPISLAAHFESATVAACDISDDCLEVARKNADTLQASVSFFQMDILSNAKNQLPSYTIIISNPPYVRDSEKSLMRENVLQYEPHSALFVDDADPLLFYREITAFAKEHLHEGGRLYFEINEALGEETAKLLSVAGFQEVAIVKDIHSKDRIVKGHL